MKRLAAVLVLALAALPAYAQGPAAGTGARKGEAKPPTAKQAAQRERMKSCNAEAGARKGEDRKAFMSTCLSADAGKKPNAQQQKMKDCNRDAGAKGLKGDARKQFMSGCLKG